MTATVIPQINTDTLMRGNCSDLQYYDSGSGLMSVVI